MPSNNVPLDFIPVILGANRGAYSLARAFFEEYGVKTVVVSPCVTGPVVRSKIICQYLQKKLTDSHCFLETLVQIEKDFPNRKWMLFGSDDLYVEMILQNQHLFSSDWIVPYINQERYNQVNDKHLFYEVCEQAGVPYPKTIVLQYQQINFVLKFPVVIKPSQSSAYQRLHFKGKKKIYICQNEKQAQESIQLMREEGYHDELIIQEYIPGDDSSLGIVTVYVAKKDRQLKLISFGNVILDDHTPSATGNSLAVHVRDETKIKQSIIKIMQAADFYGFATFDVKFDTVSNQYVFLELNARLGSSNYYVTASGSNVARYYVEDFLLDNSLPFNSSCRELLYTLLPKGLLLNVVQSDAMKEKIQHFYRTKQVYHPLSPCFENNLQRKLYVWLSSYHYYKKFREFPPLV